MSCDVWFVSSISPRPQKGRGWGGSRPKKIIGVTKPKKSIGGTLIKKFIGGQQPPFFVAWCQNGVTYF